MAWQVIKRVLGNAMPWLLAALLGFAVYQYMQAARYSAERDAARAQAETNAARAAALQSALDYRRAEAERLDAALTARDQAIAEANNEIQAKRSELAELERNDAETRDWAAQPVPDATAGWVRNLGAEAAADRDDTERAGASAGAAVSADGEG